MNTWIFQASPKVYKNVWGVLKTLENTDFQTSWAANQRASEMEPGDKVYLWIAGENAGIHAIGHITSYPHPDTISNLPHQNYVDLNIDTLLGNQYVSREKFKDNPILSGLSIVTANTGSNFLISDQKQVTEIEKLIEEGKVVVSHKLQEKQVYSKEQVEQAFSTNFGAYMNGINTRTSTNGINYIILLSKENEFYSDSIEEGSLLYTGEGQTGDQKMVRGNKALAEARDDGRDIFLFKGIGSDRYQYEGKFGIEEYFTVPEKGRTVYKYKLFKVSNEINYQNPTEIKEIEAKERQTRTVKQKIRAHEFGPRVKLLFDYTCAFCGSRILDEMGNPEVAGAHIFPVAAGGTEELSNGLALCSLHHWAFDRGLITIGEDLTISTVNKDDFGFENISKINGRKLIIPKNRTLNEYIENIRKRNNI